MAMMAVFNPSFAAFSLSISTIISIFPLSTVVSIFCSFVLCFKAAAISVAVLFNFSKLLPLMLISIGLTLPNKLDCTILPAAIWYFSICGISSR